MTSRILSHHAGVSGVTRRRFVTGLALGTASLGLSGGLTWAGKAPTAPLSPQTLRGNRFNLDVGYARVNFTGRERTAVTVNGTLPAPVLRWREGERVTLRVNNHLAEDTSIHWHGLILPANMDGVPGLSFDGIKPGGYYEYSFDLVQNGTYWYHSHSGFQEQLGHYGAIIIDPAGEDPIRADRDYVVLLSDWSDQSPESIVRTLKIQPHYYNTHERTLADLYRDIREKGVRATWNERLMWNKMAMTDRDISDVTGYTYTFLMNGCTPAQGWFGQFGRGETVRLRFINGSAMTFFDVRIPGLKMKVLAADGQYIEPVSVDEFRIGVAETYDVLVEPDGDMAYTVFAQAMDRSGYARGTLAPDPSMHAVIPEMDPNPILSYRDMGMSQDAHAGHGAQVAPVAKAVDPHAGHGGQAGHRMGGSGGGHQGHRPAPSHDGHGGHGQGVTKPAMGSGKAGFGSASPLVHGPAEFGPHVDMRAEAPGYRLDDPGVGLRDHQALYGRKVLTYGDLRNRVPTPDPREPTRELQLHLTGNMSRYLWSIDGIPFHDSEPLHFRYGERLRITFVNDTMMNHPMHLHGMWSDLETGDADFIPRKHTVIVQPGSKISYLVTADARGRWAYHCHLLYHMHGMFREVRVD